jgi:uncharacterized protein YndB with AHSA1/START domain
MAVTSSVAEKSVVCEVHVEASPETIFPFLTDPEQLVRWKGSEAVLDPRPGGIYRCQVTPKALAIGEFVEVDPPRKVVFTFGWDGEEAVPPGSSTIEITLEPSGSGTLVRLEHTGLPEGAPAQHGEGWVHFLERLEIVATGGDPGPDPWAQAEA